MPQTYFSIQALQKMIYEVLSLFYENGGGQRLGVVGGVQGRGKWISKVAKGRCKADSKEPWSRTTLLSPKLSIGISWILKASLNSTIEQVFQGDLYLLIEFYVSHY